MKEYLQSAVKQFSYYKQLGDKTFQQLADEELFWQYNDTCNSIAIIVQHLWGNMLSRWTDIFTTDGEKPWRNRDAEFEVVIANREQMMETWEEGWKRLFDTLNDIKEEDYAKLVYIRNEGHSITEAVNRQLCHYAYHVGQIVHIGKMLQNEEWKSLSIPKGNSSNYNAGKFAQEKGKRNFTDEFLNKG